MSEGITPEKLRDIAGKVLVPNPEFDRDDYEDSSGAALVLAANRIEELEAALRKVAYGQDGAVLTGEVVWSKVGDWCRTVARTALKEDR